MTPNTAPASASRANGTGTRLSSHWIDWIWHVRGTLPLAPGQSNDAVFERLSPLFRERGTSHERMSDTLEFRKKDQEAQDKMSIFDSGVLHVERTAEGPVLRYHLISRALLFCFLAPFLFLAVAQLTIAVGKLEKPKDAAASASAKKKQNTELPQSWIDKALGAPKPEKPKKDKEGEGRDKKASPTAAYVFAGIFAALYVIGRILEERSFRKLLRKFLSGSPSI